MSITSLSIATFPFKKTFLSIFNVISTIRGQIYSIFPFCSEGNDYYSLSPIGGPWYRDDFLETSKSCIMQRNVRKNAPSAELNASPSKNIFLKAWLIQLVHSGSKFFKLILPLVCFNQMAKFVIPGPADLLKKCAKLKKNCKIKYCAI